MRMRARPGTWPSASRTWASKGRPPIGTRHLWVTPASAASGSRRPLRWAARMMAVGLVLGMLPGPRLRRGAGLRLRNRRLEQAVTAQALVEDGLDQLCLGEAGALRGAA